MKMNEGMPCWFCNNKKCGFIMMSHCEKLYLWIKLNDNYKR